MSGSIESSGDIEIFCHAGLGSVGRGSVPFYGDINAGDRVSLVFVPGEGSSPPYSLKITSPSGSNIMDTLIRDLPTGGPQSPPPVEFVVSAKGPYRIEIKELRGRQKGEAKLTVG